LVFGLGIAALIETGRRQNPRRETAVAAAPPQERFQEPLPRLFVQLLSILIATRLFGTLFAKIGQPAVVGEMFAGILLGPSLFGLLFPAGYEFVFPSSSLPALKLLSQIGICLFMFAVGMDLDLGQVRDHARTAIVVSHASILFPFFLGVAISLALFRTLAGPSTSFVSFALFMGISMSITAFPVLARILQERGLTATPLGATALTCAAVDDVTAWSLLAIVVALVRSEGFLSAAGPLALAGLFVLFMLAFVRPRLGGWLRAEGSPGKGRIAGVLAITFTSALTTELIGIHSLFGAFLAGVIMPADKEFRETLRHRIETFSSIFLVPLFFAFTGLRTQIGLLDDAAGWLLCGGIILVATLGKLGGSLVAARLSGMPWRDSFALGALMNTRGLMELIAINIGYDLGILSPRIFTVLVLMALVTTAMTGPLLSLARPRLADRG
jgi:Kef-type K+ transport system membrane component KefB